ncbi:MAG: HAMP domain-containing sensor histidine kinase [Candidatus Dormiibacterota bacterium]
MGSDTASPRSLSLRRLSLQARLSALSVGTLLVLLVGGGALQYFALGQYLRSDEAGVLRQHYPATIGANLQPLRAAARCRTATGSEVVNNRVSAATAQCIVDVLSNNTVSAVLIDADGRVNSSAPADKEYPTLPLRDYLDASQGRTRPYYLVGSGADQAMVVLHPLGNRNGKSLGVVQLSEPTQPLQQTQQRLLTVLGIGTGVLILLAVVLMPLLVRRALRPLRRVTEASTELAGGDFSRRVVEPQSQDEVGRLARAFNDMAAAVQAAFTVRADSEAGMRNFVGDASHELRTPLTTIQGQLDLLQRGAATDVEAERASLESMQREVRRMSVLVEDLLTLTRLDSAASPDAVREPVDLDAIIAEVVEEASMRAPDQRVEVVTESPGEAIVRGDKEQLRRAVLNLANNALSHAPGGTHTWRTRVDGDLVIVSLSDQGTGIVKDALPRVFDRFYRASDERRSNGSGLGLAIVKSIVEAHGGRVQADSDGGGTTMTARLPRRTTLAGEPAA